LLRHYAPYLHLDERKIRLGQYLFLNHGGKVVFFGRFIAILRALTAFLAGTNRMPWGPFLLYNALGGIIWSIIYGLLGYFAGRVFHDNFAQVERLASTLGWTFGGIIVLVVAAILGWLWLRRRRKSLVDKQGQVIETQKNVEQVK